MADLTLTRVLYATTGTLGVLHDDNQAFCVTLEDPWNNNKRNISCIPTGLYNCVPHSGPSFQNVWRLLEVPGRSDILIHAGNTEADTRGCILLGTSFVPDGAHIAGSKIALNAMRQYINVQFAGKFSLMIRDFQSQSGGPQFAHTKAPEPHP